MNRPSQSNHRALPEAVQVPADGRILFFSRDRDSFFFLSNFYAATIVIAVKTWPTVEHFFQSRKSLDPAYRQAANECAHPSYAKQLAASPDSPRRLSKRSWFREIGQKVRDDWDAICLDQMRLADMAKFSQNCQLRKLLVDTRDEEIIEDTLTDPF